MDKNNEYATVEEVIQEGKRVQYTGVILKNAYTPKYTVKRYGSFTMLVQDDN